MKYLRSILFGLLMLLNVVPQVAYADIIPEIGVIHLHAEVLEGRSGASYGVELVNVDTGEVQEITLDVPSVSIKVPTGNYEIVSTDIPVGVRTINEPIQFSVPLVTKDGDTLSDFTIELKTETMLKDLIVKKVDATTDEVLQGAIFNIVTVAEDGTRRVVFEDLETNPTGQFRINGMQLGNYELIEISPPEGYRQLAEPVAFTIDEASDDVTHLVIKNFKTDPPSGPDRPITDKPTFEQTGAGMLGIALFVFIAMVGLVLVTRKKPAK